MSIKRVCDICGKEISVSAIATKYNVKIKREGLLLKDLDVCVECMNKIIEQIRSEGE